MIKPIKERVDLSLSINQDPHYWMNTGVVELEQKLTVIQRAVNMLIQEHNVLVEHSVFGDTDARKKASEMFREEHPELFWNDVVEDVCFNTKDPNEPS